MHLKSKGPGAGQTARGAGGVELRLDHIRRRRGEEVLTVRRADGVRITVTGREAQTLALLVSRGAHGFTSGEAAPLGWARRTSHYVFKLRGYGLAITTDRELTSDGSVVGRYTLMEPLQLVLPWVGP